MKSLACIAMLMLLSSAASAAQQDPPERASPELDPKVCQWMVEYQPDANGGAEYKPGIDVNGKPVVEAELNPTPLQVPDTVSFNITVDVAKYAGIDVPAGTETPASLGTVTVSKDGHMTFNGQPMEGNAEAALRALCKPKPADSGDGDKHNQ